MPTSEILLNIQTDTKAEETEIIQQFLIRLGYSPEKIYLSESPDFEIGLQDKTIGVEVTKYYAEFTKAGSKAQADFSQWKAFAVKLLKEPDILSRSAEGRFIEAHGGSGRGVLKEIC